jgi:serine/threonine-protein kinase RsbW
MIAPSLWSGDLTLRDNLFWGLEMANLNLFIKLDNLCVAREFVVQAGRDLGLDPWVIDALQLAADEACSNIFRHAYGGQGGEMEITIEPVDDGVQVVLRDWGAAFDPQAVTCPDVTAPLEQRPYGGLGLFLIRNMMDQVEFQFDRQEGNTLTMVKYVANGKDGPPL